MTRSVEEKAQRKAERIRKLTIARARAKQRNVDPFGAMFRPPALRRRGCKPVAKGRGRGIDYGLQLLHPNTPLGSLYMPHQGVKEKARRVRQFEHNAEKKAQRLASAVELAHQEAVHREHLQALLGGTW